MASLNAVVNQFRIVAVAVVVFAMALLEAGIVSFEKTEVDSATEYVIKLLEKPESAE